ncbi:putative GNAT family N-acyltransferase [Aequitasia blattaphilus]|uniref:GNAT family N-acetyltransferase n=1 Tax=Aequitasia blattaphilus TaxID=2949332 RepID=A0ABT1E6U8_9FIRM|nr:GNAT family N-acetyltransferase [Aequitasia blattaphilus]MCP1101560.1 GNAT family N-acetyltransferase [Aequitasia blattaphilus]MCR8614200.1 GNAT family N-acetyltransferase [Aequitasia blattaphilus]
MEIRVLRQEEILPALNLLWDVFITEVAPTYQNKDEGVKSFQNIIKYENIMPQAMSGSLVLFGAFENEELAGALALETRGHITLFGVKKEYQEKGVESQLFNVVKNYGIFTLKVQRITVNAAPNAVQQYQQFGMQVVGPRTVRNGIEFVPMTTLDQGAKNKTGLVVGIVVGVIILCSILCGVLFINVAREFYTSQTSTEIIEGYDNDTPDEEYRDEFEDDYEDDFEDDYEDEDLGGIAAVEAYEAKDLSINILEDSYENDDTPTGNSYLDFEVNYPQISGMKDGELQKKVNDAIRSTAMRTTDEIYINPSQDFKEKMLEVETPYLVSYVDYKVTYASNDFLSIAFEDNCCKGDVVDVNLELRTLNISLKNGKIYETKDIVNLDSDFVDEFRIIMQLETGDSKFLNQKSDDEVIDALKGKDEEGILSSVFFLDKEGIEIGFDVNNGKDTAAEYSYAWVTAPFTPKEIKDFKNNSDFWGFLEDFFD